MQTILTLFSKKDVGDVALDFELTWKDEDSVKIPVITITAEVQRILLQSDKSTKYLNALLKIEIDISKLNIDPTSYLFTHNIDEYLSNIKDNLNYTMNNSDKSNLANTQNPQKLFEIIKTLCYTFLQVSLTQVIMEMKNINHEKAKEELRNLIKGQIDVNAIGKAIITGGAITGTVYIILAALGVAVLI